MKKYLYSLIVTLSVSTLFVLLFIDNFKIVFAITTLLQFLLFNIFNTIYENILRKKAIELSIEFEEQRSKNMVNVNCPCGENTQQNILMTLSEDTLYECIKCKREIRASNQVNTLLTTTPIYTKR